MLQIGHEMVVYDTVTDWEKKMPASARPAPDIRSNGDGSVTIKYVPTQSGVHELNVAYNEQPVTGQFWLSTIFNPNIFAYAVARCPSVTFMYSV